MIFKISNKIKNTSNFNWIVTDGSLVLIIPIGKDFTSDTVEWSKISKNNLYIKNQIIFLKNVYYYLQSCCGDIL